MTRRYGETTIERLYRLTDRPNDDDCWLWQAACNSTGYPVLWDGRLVLAHRFSYEYHVGPIPDGYQIDHLCRVRNCVNPKHLEAVTQRENLRRGNGVVGVNARKTHCIHGHEFTPENTYLRPRTSHRTCRECIRISHRLASRRAS